MSGWLNALAGRMFPGATVQRLAHRDAYRVSVDIEQREVSACLVDKDFRRLAGKLAPLRPTPRVRRRLHWGPNKWGRR